MQLMYRQACTSHSLLRHKIHVYLKTVSDSSQNLYVPYYQASVHVVMIVGSCVTARIAREFYVSDVPRTG